MITYPFDKIMQLLKMSNTLLKWAIRLLVVGIIIYKEKLRPLQILAVLLAISAIVLLSIPL